MKTPLYRCALVALSIVSLGSAQAAYNPAIVASDARWVVYADLNTLRDSTLGKELIGAITEAQSQATGGFVGLDIPKLLTTVGSLTAYGSNFSNDPDAIDGTLIAEGTADLRKIAESLLLQGTIAHPEIISEVTDLPFPAYALGNSKAAAGRQTKLVVAFPPEPIVIASKSKAQLVKAREVFNGSAPSLAREAGSPFTPLASVARGAYLFAATVVPSEPVFPQNAMQTRLLQLTNSAAIALGERGTDTFIHAELHASSDANAEKLMKILQGLTAMLSMAETSDRQLGEFLNATTVSRDKDTVTLHLVYPSARLVQMMQSLRAQIEAKPAARRPQPITLGRTLAEWGGEGIAAPLNAAPAEITWRTLQNVSLVNGSMVTVGRALNGGQNARFDRVEIVAADGSWTPLVFRPEFMRAVRGSMWQFTFPGAAGVYTLKVGYLDDPTGKATFAVSVTDPNDAPKPAASKGPLIPQPKFSR